MNPVLSVLLLVCYTQAYHYDPQSPYKPEPRPVDKCSPNPCTNNGKCEGNSYGYKCICRPGCYDNKCLNVGYLTDTILFNNMFFSILEYICLFLFISKGSEGLEIEINPGVTATIGAPNVELWCSYIKDHGEHISYIYMKAKNKTNEYIQIATFYPPKSIRVADLTEQYLTGRVSLTNPTNESDKAILTFNQIQCEDDTEYTCSVSYDRGGKVKAKDTVSTSINVTSPSAKPDSIISDLPLSGVEEGQYASFVCKGNVGKPAGKFIWKKLRHGERSPIIYSDVNTTSTEIPGNCTFHGTSNLTIQLTDLDNKAKIQCVEESNMSSESLTIETESIAVYYSVRNVVITKSPHRDMIVADHKNQVNLSCAADGNPSVSFIWYKEPDMNFQLSTENLLMINDLSANTSGIYACKAYNIINGQMYNVTETINVIIGTLLRTDQEEFETTGIIIGGIIAGLIIVIVSVIVLCIRRRGVNVKLPDNPNQQSVHYSTGEDADIEQNNIKSNCADVDGTCLNNDVYNHLGDVLRNHTTSPGATGNIYDRVG